MIEDFSRGKRYSFVQKVWIVGGIFALITVILALLKATLNVLILLLAGALIAIFFRGLSDLIERKTGWNSGVCTAISIVGTLLILAGIFWLVGSKIQEQLSQLDNSLPATFENAKNFLSQSWFGQELVERWNQAQENGRMSRFFATFFRTTFGLLGDTYVILLVAVYLSVSPYLYTEGIKRLVPPRGRGKADRILEHLGSGLKQWLIGKIFAMLIIFVLTAIGLKIIGVPMWLALAIIAGLLNFIPNFGPIIAMVPAVLVALSQDPQTAIVVAALYIFIQLLESNLITPKVQQHLIRIPPALIITSQIIVATFAGIWGIILATPIILIVILLVQDLYVKKVEAEQEENQGVEEY